MNFEQWVTTVPASITEDSLWKMKAYQLALFATDIGWHDVRALARDKRTISVADQLYRALGSIGANIAEGYSYGTGANRARLYEYALDSAREIRHWYYEARHVVSEQVTKHRLNLMTRIIQLLLTSIPQQRARTLKEQSVVYHLNVDKNCHDESTQVDDLDVLYNIPFVPTTIAKLED